MYNYVSWYTAAASTNTGTVVDAVCKNVKKNVSFYYNFYVNPFPLHNPTECYVKRNSLQVQNFGQPQELIK